ncbi:MAG: hypothetical protein ACLRQK_10435 [Evtepia sp.]
MRYVWVAGFFSLLIDKDLYQSWAKTLDWLFDDNRFAKEKGWTPGQVGKFTKKAKKLLGVKDEYFICAKLDLINFPESRQYHNPVIMMGTDNSMARALVRHIRNGIAHGKTAIYKEKEELYIEIKDYGKTSGNLSGQTAYLYFPLSYIHKLYELYAEIEKAWAKDRSKTKPPKDKQSA